MPVTVRVANPELALEARQSTCKVTLERRIEPRPIFRMHLEETKPFRSRAHRHADAASVEHFHPGRKKQAIGRHIPVPVPLVRSLHGEGIALLALAKRPLAARHAFDLAHEERQQQRAEESNEERSQGDADRLISPGLESDVHIARHDESQRCVAHRRRSDKIHSAIERVYHARVGSRRRGGREEGKSMADDIRHRGIADEERPVIAHERDVAPGAGVDGPIEAVQILEVDVGNHDACEVPRIIVEPTRQYHGTASLRARSERLAHKESRVWIVALGDEIGAVRGVVILQRERPRSIQLIAFGVHDDDLAHLLHGRGTGGEGGIDARARHIRAFAPIPACRIEQQQIDGLQAPHRLLGERARHVANLALRALDRIAIGAP